MSRRTLAIIIPGTKRKSLLPLRNPAVLSCSKERFEGIYFESCTFSAALDLERYKPPDSDVCEAFLREMNPL